MEKKERLLTIINLGGVTDLVICCQLILPSLKRKTDIALKLELSDINN